MESLTGEVNLAYFLLDVKNGDMGWDGNLSPGERPQECRFTNTVVTNKTVAVSIRQSQGSVGQDTKSSDRNVGIVDLDVLALSALPRAKLKRIHGHVEFLVRLGSFGLVKEA